MNGRERELEIEGETHLAPELMARLVESEAEEFPDEWKRHILGCRRCFGLYAEMVRTDMDWILERHAEPVPEEWIAAAKKGRVSPPARRPFPGRWITGGIGVAATVTAVLLLRPGGDVSSPAPHALAPLHRAVSEASRHGMVLTPDLPGPAASFRGPGSAPDTGLAAALTRLSRRYESGDATADDAYWLVAGMIAANEPGAATVLDEAMVRFPHRPPLRNLAAVLAYRENRLGDAEAGLRAVITEHDRDPVAWFNLALVLKERGDTAGLLAVRGDLSRVLPRGSNLRARAVAELGLPD